jgi:hypothetical protein
MYYIFALLLFVSIVFLNEIVKKLIIKNLFKISFSLNVKPVFFIECRPCLLVGSFVDVHNDPK